MTDPQHTTHDALDVPDGDPVDLLAGLVLDARTALHALEEAFRDAACPGCHTADDVTALGRDLVAVHGLDVIDADFLLAHAADTREVMRRVLQLPTCARHDDDSDEHGGGAQ